MAMSYSRSVIGSFLLVSSIALSGCVTVNGSDSSGKSSESAASASASESPSPLGSASTLDSATISATASASESATAVSTGGAKGSSSSNFDVQESLPGLQYLANNIALALTTPIDRSLAASGMTQAEATLAQQTLDSLSKKVVTAKDFVYAISQLSPEEKSALSKLVNSDQNVYNDFFYTENLTEDEKLYLSLLNFSTQLELSGQLPEIDQEDNIIDPAVVKVGKDGEVSIPVEFVATWAIGDITSDEFFRNIPVTFADGTWKIDGKRYIESSDDLAAIF